MKAGTLTEYDKALLDLVNYQKERQSYQRKHDISSSDDGDHDNETSSKELSSSDENEEYKPRKYEDDEDYNENGNP